MTPESIETERLVLRRWRESDRDAFADIHADPEVMQWLGRDPLTREDSDAMIAEFERHFDAHGFGYWVIERRLDGAVVGCTGLRRVVDPHPRAPCVEIAWRQASAMWGHGYMTEAASAALADGFERVGLEEIFAWTAIANVRSQSVMRRIGRDRDASKDFDAIVLPEGHPLRPQIVFRISAEDPRR